MEFVGLTAVLFTLLWLAFLFSEGRFMSKQREANRQIGRRWKELKARSGASINT
jgi:hypothetical protein